MSSPRSLALGPDVFPTRRDPDRIGTDWVPVLKDLPLFESVPSRHLRRIPARIKRYSRGEPIVRAGDPGNAFYVILDGTARVVPTGRRPITLKAGDSFGEMALLDGAPRSADVTADSEVTAMVVGRAAFAKLLRREPQIALVLLRTLAARLRAAQKQQHY